MTKGTGSATADTAADAFGRMSADSSTTGGSKGGLLGTKTRTSAGSARAYVSDGVEVSAGVYEVTVTYTGAYTRESERGNGSAQGRVLATAYFFADDGFGESVVVGVGDAELTATASTVVVRYEVQIPADGGLSVSAELQALSSAKGKGNSASTASLAGATFYTFTKIG